MRLGPPHHSREAPHCDLLIESLDPRNFVQKSVPIQRRVSGSVFGKMVYEDLEEPYYIGRLVVEHHMAD